MPTDISGLNRFLRRLDKVQTVNAISKTISYALAYRGVAIAKDFYDKSSTREVNVYVSNSMTADYAIKAVGKRLTFLEFGTGKVGENTYDGQLPESGIPITGAWQYYYPSKYKHTTKSGKKGWFFTREDGQTRFTQGIEARAQMYKTSVELRSQAKNIVSDIVREYLK